MKTLNPSGDILTTRHVTWWAQPMQYKTGGSPSADAGKDFRVSTRVTNTTSSTKKSKATSAMTHLQTSRVNQDFRNETAAAEGFRNPARDIELPADTYSASLESSPGDEVNQPLKSSTAE